MDVLVLTSKLLGVYLGVSGLFLIFKSKTVPHLLEDFFEHRAVTYLTGIILIFLSSMYLIQYNIWTDTWHIALSIVAWLVLLKGLAYVFIPKLLSKVSIKKFQGWLKAWGVIAVIVGIYLYFI